MQIEHLNSNVQEILTSCLFLQLETDQIKVELNALEQTDIHTLFTCEFSLPFQTNCRALWKSSFERRRRRWDWRHGDSITCNSLGLPALSTRQSQTTAAHTWLSTSTNRSVLLNPHMLISQEHLIHKWQFNLIIY